MSNINDYLDKIICGDCMDTLRKFPNECIDLVVTSPPYNLRNSVGNGMKHNSGKWPNAALLINGYDNYDDCIPEKEYAEWQHKVLLELLRVIKNDGAIFYNHKYRIQDGLIQDRRDIVFDVPLRQIIIWKRKGALTLIQDIFFQLTR